MPSPKSALFRITTDNKYFFSYFEQWFKKHNACEKVWWNMNEKNNWTYIIQFNPEKSYSNFCELLKIAFKDAKDPITYTVSAEKEFSDKKEFRLYYEKDKSFLASFKVNKNVVMDKFHEEKNKILSKDDLNFNLLLNLIISIHEQLDSQKYIDKDYIYLETDNINAVTYIFHLVKAIIPVPFILNKFENYDTHKYLVVVQYIFGLQQPPITPELIYKNNYTSSELYDFHNRVIGFAKKNFLFPETYTYPYEKITTLKEKIFEDFNSIEHKILKVIKQKEKSQAAGTGLSGVKVDLVENAV